MEYSGDNTHSDGLDEMLSFSVYKADQAYNRVYRDALEPLGLTYPQFLTMRLLWANESLTIGDISSRLGLDSGTITPLTKRLISMGLVTKERRFDDERRVDIRLTDAGRALRTKSESALRFVDEIVGLDKQAVDEMLMRVSRIISNLEKKV